MRQKQFSSPSAQLPIPVEMIERRIYLIRGQKVMRDSDLAELYEVTTGNLNLAVRRNLDRFPQDFMFQLTEEEFTNLRLQIATSSSGYGGRRYLPYVFTEHGVAMLSAVLKSSRAVQMSIRIIRAFIQMRELLASHRELARQVERLQAAQKDHAGLFTIVIRDIQSLAKNVKKEFKKLKSPRRRKSRMGFYTDENK